MNEELLASFTEYCKANPEQRFWQALRNWSGHHAIWIEKTSTSTHMEERKVLAKQGLEDTFYRRER